MAINKITLEQDGLHVGSNQLIASGGNITVGRNLVVQGNNYTDGTFLGVDRDNVIANTGYSRLTNGLILQWGTTLANNTVGNVIFPKVFPNAVYSVTAMVVSGSVAYSNAVAYLAGPANTTVAQIRANKIDGANNIVYWTAIGG
jgi:hypothetical protein